MVAPLRYAEASPAADEAFRAQAPDTSPVVPSASFDWSDTTLDNGLRVLVLERHALPIVSTALVVLRGSAEAWAPHDTESILEGLLAEGTRGRTRDELMAAWSGLGARHGISLGPDGCMLMAKVSSGHVDAAIALLAETAMTPRLTVRDFSNVRSRWQREYQQGGRDKDTTVNQFGRSMLFGAEHAYGSQRASEAHTLALTVEDIAALHAQIFRPSQAALVVVGDVSFEAARASAARRLGVWRGGEASSTRKAPPSPRAGPRVVLVTRQRRSQVFAHVSARAPEGASPDVAPLEVLARALGGHTSPLHDEVREVRGAAYSLNAELDRMRSASVLSINGALEESKAIDALQAMLAAVRRARTEDLGAAEIERARTSLLSEWRAQVAKTDALTAMAASALTITEPLRAIEDYPARIQAVTAADIRRVAARYLGDGSLRLVIVAPDSFEAKLADLGLGPVTLWDPDSAAAGP
jgi:zinc protease